MLLFKFLLGRLLAIPITLFVITFILYGIVTIAPAEERALLHIPLQTRSKMPEELLHARLNQIIEEQPSLIASGCLTTNRYSSHTLVEKRRRGLVLNECLPFGYVSAKVAAITYQVSCRH